MTRLLVSLVIAVASIAAPTAASAAATTAETWTDNDHWSRCDEPYTSCSTLPYAEPSTGHLGGIAHFWSDERRLPEVGADPASRVLAELIVPAVTA